MWHNEICNRRKDGSLYWVDSTITNIIDIDGEPKFLAIRFDITARKEIEAHLIQSSRLMSLGEMSAGIAHEINNPLAIAFGAIDLLQKYKNNPDKFIEKIHSIENALERIAKTVKGLRKFSRSSNEESYKSIHDLSKIIFESINLTEINAKRSFVSIKTDITTYAKILCDELEIEQVLINLINNAIYAAKISQEKWVKINLFEENNLVILQVLDSGAGISDKIVHQIFEPFYTTKPVGEGTGLGLSISKGILDSHNASIRVVRNLPNTCFEVHFNKINEDFTK